MDNERENPDTEPAMEEVADGQREWAAPELIVENVDEATEGGPFAGPGDDTLYKS